MGILRSGGRWLCARAVGDALEIGCAGDIAAALEGEGHSVAVAESEHAAGLPFDEESFDTVLLGDFLASWSSCRRPIAEARRVLRPSGRLIVAVPYPPGPSEDGSGLSLQDLLDGLGTEFSVEEIELVEGRLCLLAERKRPKGRAGAWAARRALEVVEGRLAERKERALAAARDDVERLETALAAATHERDLQAEAARLAGDGVAALGQRLEQNRAQAEGQLAETEASLETAQGKIESRDAELKRLRAAAREQDRKLALGEARLEEAQRRAAQFHDTLVDLRAGSAYRLMRMLWRLRRPFRRAPRDAARRARTGDEGGDSPARTDPPSARPLVRRPTPKARPLQPTCTLQPGERLRVASILDEMSAACFAPECELIPLTLDGWREQLDDRQPDLLLVESAWNGNGGEWQYQIATYPRKDLTGLPALTALVEECRERGIPTAFWNKEDPTHFTRFAEAAARFEHVFTTDANLVDVYHRMPSEVPGERTVAPLPFAAQPRLHNPVVAVEQRATSPCFAGAWYRDRHSERRQSLEGLLDAARPYGLVIYDRRFGEADNAFGFPVRFQPHIVGSLPYEGICDVYKSHRVFLNANSVTGSPTMCSRRVFELAACDTAILSTPANALERFFGEDVIVEATNEEDATEALERLLGDPAEHFRRTRAARRAVFAEHTYADRLALIAGHVGLDGPSSKRQPFDPPGDSSDGASANGDGNPPPWQLALQPGLGLSEPALVDFAAATTFADADVIGVHPGGNGSIVEHRYVDDLDPRALLLRRELVEERGGVSGSAEEVRARLREWNDQGIRLYAADADLISLRDAPLATGLR
jgi:hypothetical protein